jgi:hypothetical protein
VRLVSELTLATLAVMNWLTGPATQVSCAAISAMFRQSRSDSMPTRVPSLSTTGAPEWPVFTSWCTAAIISMLG